MEAVTPPAATLTDSGNTTNVSPLEVSSGVIDPGKPVTLIGAMTSHDKHFNIGALRHAGNLAVILVIAVCVDVTLRTLVGKGLLDPTSFPYRCVAAVATVIEACHSFLLICMVLHKTWHEIEALARSLRQLSDVFPFVPMKGATPRVVINDRVLQPAR